MNSIDQKRIERLIINGFERSQHWVQHCELDTFPAKFSSWEEVKEHPVFSQRWDVDRWNALLKVMGFLEGLLDCGIGSLEMVQKDESLNARFADLLKNYSAIDCFVEGVRDHLDDLLSGSVSTVASMLAAADFTANHWIKDLHLDSFPVHAAWNSDKMQFHPAIANAWYFELDQLKFLVNSWDILLMQAERCTTQAVVSKRKELKRHVEVINAFLKVVEPHVPKL